MPSIRKRTRISALPRKTFNAGLALGRAVVHLGIAFSKQSDYKSLMAENTAAVQRSCPVCHGQTAAPLWTKGSLRLVRCATCSMVFASPVPPELAHGNFYAELGKPFYLSPEKLQSDYATVRYQRELRLFRSFCLSGKVLDVGCSTGAFLYQLKTRWPGAYQVIGTDVVPDALEYAESQGIPVLQEGFLQHAPASAYDAITFWAVLEHLADPKQFLAKAADLLNPGGHCFILVPNFRSLATRFLGPRYRYIMAEHLNYFTSSTLRMLVAREPRFTILHTAFTHFNPVVIWQDWRAPKERVPDAERTRLLQQTTAWKKNPSLKPLRLAYAALEKFLASLALADNLLLILRRK